MDHLDPTHDVVVERFQILGRNPPLRVLLSADLLDTVPFNEGAPDLESGHVALAEVRDVPLVHLDGISLVGDGVEDWLPRQPGRPTLEATDRYQIEFLLADGTW
ncbi:hypothetical protein [Metapseudomonas otitidis]|uniref:hypothetical protein n=1 Tax=Metapseudomonas otitidis TaxID=319939 RepID=UPI0013F654B2|nr:hypothetical protein [Pseudomonas otitidis]